MATGDKLGAVMQSDIGSTASGGVAHQAVEPSLAPEFSASGTYAAGDFVMRDGVLHVCSTPHTTAAWDASHFTAVNAATYLKMVAAANAVADAGVAPGGFGWASPYTIVINASSSSETYAQFGAKVDSAITNLPANSATIAMVMFPPNVGNTASYAIILKYATNNNVVVYGLPSHYHPSDSRIIFVKYNGNWQPWEWINPPLLDGIEYRTTERHVGGPVYAMRKAAKASNGVLPIVLPANTDVIIDLYGSCVDRVPFRTLSEFDHAEFIVSTGTLNLYFTGYDDRWIYPIIKYTKSS